ncbi:sec-independent protein translocase protein TATA, chloroplastic-like [Tasmannia lanceolata]|uniref:sec-independent protein translocase protein TATA, chloroplastic-like n=1 Tax=Tasmannia lanceolata TaxID=3420 RepID=UPI004063AF22
MEISSTTSLLLHTVPRTPPLSLSSSNSIFFRNGRKDFSMKKNNCMVLSRNKAQRGLNCRCLFGLGVPELAVIAGVAALVFGPKKLPEIGKSIGKTVKSFQQAAKEFETELKTDSEDTIESPSGKPTAVSEGTKQELEASSTKESL